LFDESQLIKNYYINASGQIVASNGFAYSNLIPVKQATYMLSGRNTENITSNKRVHGYDENGDWVKQITYVAVTRISDYSTSILIDDASIKYIRLSIYGSDADVQLELGSSITSYIEHQSQTYPLSLGNIELNSSPDETIRDQIVGKPNEWYKREYIHKFVITGTELWNKYSTDRYFLNASQISVPLKLRGGTYCTHFKWETSQSSAKLNNCIYITSNNGNLEIYPSQEFLNTYNTAAKFKEYLQTEYSNNNPVIAYYQRLEYTDIPITDTTLINQLNDIYNNAHSYNDVTNITTTYEDGNEQMYLDIEALAKGGSTTTETDPIFSASASSGITSSDISNWNNKADVEDIPDLTDYVKNTDYASSSKGGVTKTGWYNFQIESGGHPYVSNRSYNNYLNDDNLAFISKGTLENVITGKNLADKNYVDTAIATAITNTLGGSY
jgi:hypothetical protein